jgi:organic radical activating enzyme
MNTFHVLRAWKAILAGRAPSLSIEVTRECPLRCPGCYAYEDKHLGGGLTLRQLRDFKGDDLVRGVVDVVDQLKPLHVSLVGGDPLVRYRELEIIVPKLIDRGVHVQVVTSAFRQIPVSWVGLDHLTVVVSIDGLPADHDERRKPATYERILKSIEGSRVTLHCTVTAQMLRRAGYLDEFLAFWTPRPEIDRVWFSLFTPQRGDFPLERLSGDQRSRVVGELLDLRRTYPKVDMPVGLLKQFGRPPTSPSECIFAQTTETISADLRTRITPCQFGGDPECSECGCVASMGLAAIGDFKLGFVPVGSIFKASARIGKAVAKRRRNGMGERPPAVTLPVTIAAAKSADKV